MLAPCGEKMKRGLHPTIDRNTPMESGMFTD